MTVTEDPLAMFRPQYKNEKPDTPDNDPLFAFRPSSEQQQYKQPVAAAEPMRDETLPGGNAPWWQKFGKALSMQSRVSNAVEPKAAPTVGKAALSGATFGGSELIPGLKVGEEYPEIATAYKTGAGLESIGGLHKLFSTPLIKLAEKSPYATKALSSLADMIGWGVTGATEKALTDVFQGKMPSSEDLLAHGGEWAALDAALKTAGLGGRFASWLVGRAKSTKQPPWQVVNDLLTNMKQEGVDISATDRVTARVLAEFEKPVEEATKAAKEIKLSKGLPLETPEKVGIETLETAAKRPPSGPFGQTPPAPPEYRTIPPEQRVDLANRKIEPVELNKISERSEALSEPYKPGGIDAESAMQEIGKSRADELVEKLGERAETEQQLGHNIKADIEKSFEAEQQKYTPLYQEVETGAKNIMHKPNSTIKLVNSILEHINALKTRPEGYAKVINTLNTSLEDMGYHIAESGGKVLVRDAAGKPINLKGFTVQEAVPLSKSMELARRLNKIVDYDIVGPSIKNQLKPVVSALKKEIKAALAEANPALHKKFVEAEGLYASTAKKYGNEVITGIRGQAKPEHVAASLLEPTVLEHVKKTVSPAQYNELQREILQHLRDMPFAKARSAYREIGPFLTKDAQDAARSIIAHKSPRGAFATAQDIKGGIITDLNKAFTTGERPKKVLDLWKTIKGQKLIEEALKGTPNKAEVLEYLRRQSFFDFASSVVDPSGTINFKKFDQYLKDPATIRNLHQIGGDEAVKFFTSLKNMSNGIKFNVNMLERLPKVELRPAKGRFKLGEEKLLRGAERIKAPAEEVQKFHEILPPTKPEKVSHQQGKRRLAEAARKRQLRKFQLQEFLEDYNLTSVPSLLKALGILTHTKTLGGYLGLEIAAKKLYRMATNSTARESIKKLLDTSKQATGGVHDVTPLLITLVELDHELVD